MVTRFGDGIWWYDLRGVNAYLVDDGGVLTLVDAGNPWNGRRLRRGIDDAGYTVADVDRVLVTHFDVDHVGSLGRVRGLDATVYVGEADAGLVRGVERPEWHTRKGLLQTVVDPFVAAPRCPVEPVSDGDTVGSFTAYHTPGHTPGHVAYVSEELAAGFLGDLVIERGGELRPSPWPLSYDVDAVTESIRDLADRAPEFEVAGMGHGTPFGQGGRGHLRDLADSL